MGQKVNPIGFRLGINKEWASKWFSSKDYSCFVYEDYCIRKFLKKKLQQAGISKIEIERAANKVKLKIHTARPGLVIGRKGSEIQNLTKDLTKIINREFFIDIQEVRKPEVDAQLLAENIALQLVRRVSFRRAMKKSVTSALRFGVQGIKIYCSGRLGGAEMAIREWYRKGRVPLHTIRADIDYGFAEALTTYGIIGIKVTIFNGEILPDKKD